MLLFPDNISPGNNMIAVEVHQINATSSDLSFNLQLTANPVGGTTFFISNGAVWKYLDINTRPAGWETSAFNDAAWLSGNAELGYGDSPGDESTIVSFGPTSTDKYRTTYFRKSINIDNPQAYSNFTFNVERDDGFVLYVNGTEVGRNNMPAGIPNQSTFAVWVTEDSVVTVIVPNTAFSVGNNVISVEIHQINAASSDISFNLQLTANPAPATTTFISNSAIWKYLDDNTRPAGWETTTFADGAWASGPAKLGFGDPGMGTTVKFCSDPNNKYITTYFRKTVNIPNPASFENFTIHLIRDDGAIVYINGVEVFKSNMPPNAPTQDLLASGTLEVPTKQMIQLILSLPVIL